jgi:ferrous iron transport protein B
MSECCDIADVLTLEEVRAQDTSRMTRLHVALVGQPNVGKSTVFNLLTGLNQHVGNWPGKTIDQKIGVHQRGDLTCDVVDLPGTYSLTANSPEELIAREYVLKQRPDVIVAIVDASILERSLYLVAELVQLGLPLVVGLNMLDVARQNGTHIDTAKLSQSLGVPVIELIAAQGRGIDRLIDEAIEAARRVAGSIHSIILRPDLEAALSEIETLITDYLPEEYPLTWSAQKLLEGDSIVTQILQREMKAAEWQSVEALLPANVDANISIASARYDWIAQAIRSAVTRTPSASLTWTARIDRITTHPLWGLIVLATILASLFGLTYAIGSPLQEWLEANVIGGAVNIAQTILINAPLWLRGLIIDGAIGGAGTVLTFAPILLIFFAGMALLEDIGYMGRAAYLMDGVMRRMGLHGKSFLPLFLGFGCNVPAVMGTRVIEAERPRLLSILIAPLVPCTARMAVVAFMTPAFFGANAPLVAFALVLLNLIVLAVVGAIVNRAMFKNDQAAFIMELPQYHWPKSRSIVLIVWQRTIGFIKQAGTAILIMSLIIWALAYFPNGQVETSWLGEVGRALSPLGGLMGLDWKLLIALLASFVAKENSIAILGVLFSADGNHTQLASTLATAITPIAALSFLVVSMLFIPCASTVATIRKETRSWKWTLFTIGLLAGVSFGVGIAVYQVLSRVVV